MSAWQINIPGMLFMAFVGYVVGYKRGLREKREAKAKMIDGLK